MYAFVRDGSGRRQVYGIADDRINPSVTDTRRYKQRYGLVARSSLKDNVPTGVRFDCHYCDYYRPEWPAFCLFCTVSPSVPLLLAIATANFLYSTSLGISRVTSKAAASPFSGSHTDRHWHTTENGNPSPPCGSTCNATKTYRSHRHQEEQE